MYVYLCIYVYLDRRNWIFVPKEKRIEKETQADRERDMKRANDIVF